MKLLIGNENHSLLLCAYVEVLACTERTRMQFVNKLHQQKLESDGSNTFPLNPSWKYKYHMCIKFFWLSFHVYIQGNFCEALFCASNIIGASPTIGNIGKVCLLACLIHHPLYGLKPLTKIMSNLWLC